MSAANGFTGPQVKRIKLTIRQLAAAAVTLPQQGREMSSRPRVLARMAVFMATGTKWGAVGADFMKSLISYAETSLATYAEGGE